MIYTGLDTRQCGICEADQQHEGDTPADVHADDCLVLRARDLLARLEVER